LPATYSSTIFEGNRPIGKTREIKFSGIEKGKAKFSIGSGSYDFIVKNQ